MRLRLLIGFFLSMSAASLAQNVTIIETRGTEPTYSDYNVKSAGGGGWGTDTDLLAVTFSLPDGPTLPIGQPYDYEVTVTNKSKIEMLLPRCVEWSDIADGHPKELKYYALEINFIFSAPKMGRSYLGGNLMLYGRASKPSTMVILGPGDSLQLNGRVRLTAPWLPIPAHSAVKVHVQAAVRLAEVWLHPLSTSDCLDCYNQVPKQAYYVRSEKFLPAELTTKEALDFPPKPTPPASSE